MCVVTDVYQEELVERAFVHVDYEFRDFNEHEEQYESNIPISDQVVRRYAFVGSSNSAIKTIIMNFALHTLLTNLILSISVRALESSSQVAHQWQQHGCSPVAAAEVA